MIAWFLVITTVTVSPDYSISGRIEIVPKAFQTEAACESYKAQEVARLTKPGSANYILACRGISSVNTNK